jgi:hypothetical protein
MNYPDERYSTQLQYRSAGEAWREYWLAYGAWPAVTRSPYLHAAIFLSAVMAPLWLRVGWWSDVITVLPSILGFSIAAMALLMGFGDERFRALIARAGGSTPTYVKIIASFAHFIIVQTLALVLALVCKAWSFPLPAWFKNALIESGVSQIAMVLRYAVWFAGFAVFMYAMMCALSVTLYILRLAIIFSRVIRMQSQKVVREEGHERRKEDTSDRVPASIH